MVEDVGGERVEPAAEQAAVLPNSGDAGDPKNHEEAGDIDGDGDAVVFATEDFDGKID